MVSSCICANYSYKRADTITTLVWKEASPEQHKIIMHWTMLLVSYVAKVTMHNSLPHAHSWWASTLTIFSFTMFSISVARSVVLPSAAFRDTLEDCGGRRCVKHPHPQARMPTCISTGTASPNTPPRLSDASAFVNHLPPSPPILSPDLHYHHHLGCISTRNSVILLCNKNSRPS